MYANMTEELLDPKTVKIKKHCVKNVLLTLRNTLAGAEPDVVVKAQATLEASTTEPGALIGLIELGALQKIDDPSNP